MKVLVFIAFLNLALSGPSLRTMQTTTFSSSIDVIKGLLQGIKSEIEVESVQNCITDIEAIIPDLSTAVVEYKTHTKEGVKSALMLISLALKELPAAMLTCQKGHVEAAFIIEGALRAFEKPWSLVVDFGKAIILNGQEIKTELSGMAIAWDNHNMHAFGYSLGRMILAVTKTSDLMTLNNPSSDESLLFIEGVLSGVKSGFSVDQVKACISEVESLGSQIESAFGDIKTETLDGVVKGIQTLGESLSIIHEAISICKPDALIVIEDIKSASKQLAEPFTLAYHIGRALLINEKQIYNELSAASNDWKSADYFNSGVNIGKVMNILVGVPETVKAKGIYLIKQ